MTEIELCPDGLKMRVAAWVDGTLTERDRFDPVSAKARDAVARRLGIDRAWLLARVEDVRKDGSGKKFVVSEDRPGEAVFTIRGMETPSADGERVAMEAVPFLKSRLATVPVDTLIEWSGLDAVCCLDIDYHDVKPPHRDWLENIVLTRVSPRPFAWHFSRGGGLHLFYVRGGSLTADELASCAALRFRTIDASAGLELKRCVRGPGSAPVRVASVVDPGAGLVEWLGAPEFDTADRDTWMESEGFSIGGKYDHTRCPINPTPGHPSTGDPVRVNESGIYCHRCAGEGRSMGCRRAGFAPWPALLGSPSAGELGIMVRKLTHWGHAKWVLTRKYQMLESFALLGYRAALKTYHEGKPTEGLVSRVFDEKTDDLARVNNLWVSIPKSYIYPKDIQPLLGRLPACQFVDDKGNVKTDPAAVCEFQQAKDLTDRGYPDINVIHGARLVSIGGGPVSAPTTVAVPNAKLAAHHRQCVPTYVPKPLRMGEEAAWKEIETVFPAVDRTLVKLLICAFGCAQETRAGMPPFLFVTGSTGVAKTATCMVASGIFGAAPYEATYHPDPAKFRESVWNGAKEGPLVLCNELLKESARGRFKLSAREALDPLLTLTENSTSWVAYRGPLKMGRLPVVVITEPQCPAHLRDEAQLARRIWHYTLYGTKTSGPNDWKASLGRAGLSHIHLLRTVSDAMAKACDAIVSDIADTYFSTLMSWDTIAESLGVKTILEGEAFEDLRPLMLEFFRLVCAAPTLTGRVKKLYPSGYKRISRTEAAAGSVEDDLCAVYSRFADGNGGDWVTSRRLQEKDWGGLLGTDQHVRLDMTAEGSAVLVRFAVGPAKVPKLVNEQIVDPSSWEKIT